MPEIPVDGYAPYRLWGCLPRQAGWWARLVDWAWGRDCRLLYLGITSRAGFVRWAEHSDDKSWARDVSYAERDDDIRWPTLYDAVLDDTGRLVLVVDPRQDDGLRPARPGELIDPHPMVRQFRGDTVQVYRPHPAGRPVRGRVIEGARTGEQRMIRAEAPIHNREHNEGNAHAVNRRRRILPRHAAEWRRRAGHLALVWLLVASLLTWLLSDTDDGWREGAAAAADGVAGAAVLILLAQLARQAVRGRVNLTLQRRRTRRRRRSRRRR
ncbi:hypothetical protein ACIBTV_27620 [Micromonospora sp. NPDC049366]|uniref:hypothetical protein n=1 Tax=Micromonospora sp. NPDC049366 TaxID=3364271 RepID=UPI00378CDAFC